MSQISVESFIYGVRAIAKENPTFKVGHDSSDGSCDGMGLIRGSLLRGGATKITNMKEPNQFARKSVKAIRKIDSSIKRGEILLKKKDANDSSMPLPSKFRSGGSEYTGDTNNYTDVAVVLRVNPTKIVYMSPNGIVESSDLTEWDYVCELQYVLYGGYKKEMKPYTIHSDGTPVKMFAEKSFSSNEIASISDESMVLVHEKGTPWAKVSYGDKTGYVLSKYIVEKTLGGDMTISNSDRAELEKAYVILGKLLGYIK